MANYVEITFNPADAADGLALFLPALTAKGAVLGAPEKRANKDQWGTLTSSEALGFTIAAAQAALLLRPVLLIWLGRGKRVYIKSKTQEVVLENFSADDIDRILSSLDE